MGFSPISVNAAPLVFTADFPGFTAVNPMEIDLIHHAATSRICLAYCPANLPLSIQAATRTGSTWSTATAYTTPGSRLNLNGICLAPNGTGLGLAVADATTNTIALASFNGTDWSTANLTTSGGSPELSDPFLCYNSSGVRQLMYYAAGGTLRYNGGSGGMNFPGTLHLPTPITMDPAGGRPVFVQVKDTAGNLYLQRQGTTLSSWTAQLVQNSSGFPNFNGLGASIAYGQDGQPRVAWLEEKTKQLRVATYNGTAWSIAVPGNVSAVNFNSRTRLISGPGGVLYLGVFTYNATFSTNELRLWRNPGGIWESQQIGLSSGKTFGMASDQQSLWIAYTLNTQFNNVVVASTALPPAPAPEISLSSAGNILSDGETATFGNVAAGGSATLTLTVANTGNLPLTGLGLTLVGPDAAAFAISQFPTAPVFPGNTTTFVVRFTASGSGPRTASLHLASNDADENPYDLVLTATAATPLAVFSSAISSQTNLTGPAAAPDATPFQDGVPNLLKYAFNLNLQAADNRTLPAAGASGTAGLPVISTTGPGATSGFRLTFLRRKGSGLIYTPKHSARLDPVSFVPFTAAPVITSLDDTWERVAVTGTFGPGTPPTRHFSVVQVSFP